jgi:UDP-glucose 4-epimerase
MKFLITGGAGFIGSHIAEELIKSKKGEVVVFDNLSMGKKENIPKGCRFIKGDIRNEAAIIKAMKGIDVIFHDAAFVSIRASFDMLKHEVDNNVYGTLNVLEAAVKNKVKKLVFASSMAVYGEPKILPVEEDSQLKPISPYGFSKLRGELYCKIFQDKFGIDTTVLRYFNTFGIRQTPSDYVGVTTTFINQALSGKPLTIFGDGKQTRDFVWVKDIARANVLAAFSKKSRGEILNIASGQEISINNIADSINKYVGNGRVYVSKPGGEISRIRANIAKAKKVLGYKPEGDLLMAIPVLIDWWKEKQK